MLGGEGKSLANSKSTVAHLIELGRSLALKTPNEEHQE